MMRLLTPLLVVTLLLPAVPAEGQGQGQGGRPLRVTGVQDLTFGTILPGVPITILRSDPINSGQFEIRGQRLTEVLVDLLLPGELVGPVGSSIPLVFGPGSAGYSVSGAIGAQVSFDPDVPQAFTLPGNGRGTIFLGGTATPPPQLPAGAYAATITVTLTYLAN